MTGVPEKSLEATDCQINDDTDEKINFISLQRFTYDTIRDNRGHCRKFLIDATTSQPAPGLGAHGTNESMPPFLNWPRNFRNVWGNP